MRNSDCHFLENFKSIYMTVFRIRYVVVLSVLLLFLGCRQQLVELDIFHSKMGNLDVEIDSLIKSHYKSIYKLTIKGNAYLDANDCKTIKVKFTSRNLKTLDLSEAKFIYNMMPDTKEGVFSNMKMKEVFLPSNLISIGNRAFANCYNLEFVDMPAHLKTITSEAFINCKRLTIDLLPNTIDHIGQSAFENCSSLSLNKLPDNLTGYIRANSFSNTKVNISIIPDKITAIKEGAFKNTNITDLYMPYGFEEISSNAFKNCRLQTIHFGDSVPPWTDTRTKTLSFKGVDLNHVTLFVPVGSSKNYMQSPPWVDFNKITEDCVIDGIAPKNPRRYKTIIDDIQREYLVYIPQNNEKYPDGIIILLHAFDETMYDIMKRNNIMMIADDINMILIAPQALPIQDKKVRKIVSTYYSSKFEKAIVWNSGVGIKGESNGKTIFNQRINKNVDDVRFIRDVSEDVIKKYNVDRRNYFVFGISMGGCMAYQYALHYGDDITGLINVAGTMGLFADTLKTSSPFPILDFHSTTDDIIPYDGVHKYTLNNIKLKTAIGLSVKKTLNYWSRKNNTKRPTIESYEKKGGISVEKLTFEEAENPIIHYRITGGRHTTELFTPRNPISYRNEILSFILTYKE